MARSKAQEVGSKGKEVHDPLISKLFSSSLGPVRSESVTTAYGLPSGQPSSLHGNPLDNTDGFSESGTDDTDAIRSLKGKISHRILSSPVNALVSNVKLKRKRRRDKDEVDIEGMYVQRITAEALRVAAAEEARQPKKRQRCDFTRAEADQNTSPALKPSEVELNESEGNGNPDPEVPQHESLTPSKEKFELDKSARTVFLANVCTSSIKSKTAKKALLDHLISFSNTLLASNKAHKIESIRFRSTAFVSGVGPKKAAYAKKELMDTTTRSTNAYVVYTTPLAAREAVKRLNGTTILDRHLLVDSVAHPRKTDPRRCVFVGNLEFVDDDSKINAAKEEQVGQKSRKPREPSDIEEGLWRQFSKTGSVESVRVVRDANTRVGKGFAYVQFENEISVEKALAYNEKRFPPLLPRILRVTRAKKITKNALSKSEHGNRAHEKARSNAIYIPKVDSAAQSLSGRAGRLFGRAGAAYVKGQDGFGRGSCVKGAGSVTKTPEQALFEGYRASSNNNASKQGTGAQIGGLKKKRPGKPRTRSSRRGAAFKATGGRKGGIQA
ncbi:MAG: hypothetical protein Q9223_000475 [Gallowayella weberi]